MDNRKLRNSSIELLRLIAMLLIIVLHIVHQGLGFQQYCLGQSLGGAIVDNLFLLIAIQNLCIVGVNVFILISGYYGIKLRWKSLTKFLFVCFVFKGLHLLIEFCGDNQQIFCLHTMTSLFSIITHPSGWFVRCYFLLMLFSPILNKAIVAASDKDIRLFVLICCIISVYMGFLRGDEINSDGYTLMQFVTLYLIGRSINIFQIYKKLEIRYWMAIYILGIILNTVLMCVLISNNRTLSLHLLAYNNPIIIINSIAMFCIFIHVNFNNSFINYIASGTFGIYLFHTGPYLWRQKLSPYIYETYILNDAGIFILRMIMLTLGLMFVGVLLNLLIEHFYVKVVKMVCK